MKINTNSFLVLLALGIASLVLISVPASSQPILCQGIPATIIGTPGDDEIMGTSSADIILGLGGNDSQLVPKLMI